MIFQKIITNSTAWSFLISGFTGLLAFNGRNKIFSIINKGILSILTSTISGLLIKQGSETGTGLLNLAYIRDVIYKTIETSNPITGSIISNNPIMSNNQIIQETIKHAINNKEVIESSATGFNVLLETGMHTLGNIGLYGTMIGMVIYYLSPSFFNNIKLIPEKFIAGFTENDNDSLYIKIVTGIVKSTSVFSLENYLVLLGISLGVVCFFYIKKKIGSNIGSQLDIEIDNDIE